jgi:hypothetical protein
MVAAHVEGAALPGSAAAAVELKGTVEKEVNQQYDSDASMAFYEYVMGGGGDDIHYGVFLSERDGLKESAHNSIEMLASMAESCGALKKVFPTPRDPPFSLQGACVHASEI